MTAAKLHTLAPVPEALSAGASESARHAAALALRDQERYAEAATAIMTSIRLNPADGHAFAILADVFLANQQPQEAAVAVERASALLPSSALVRRLRAQIAIAQEEFATAVRLAKAAVKASPRDAEAVAVLIEAHLAGGAVEKARKAIETAIGKLPENVLLYRARASVHQAEDNPEAALEDLERAAALAPDEAGSWVAIANHYFKAGERDTAIESLRRGVEHLPGSVPLHHTLGLACMNLNHFEDAGNILAKTVTMAPDFALLRAQYAQAQMLLQNHGAALQAADEAIRLDPKLPLAHFVRGMAHRRAGQSAESRTSLERAIALSPDFYEAHYFLGNTLTDLGEIDAALQCFERADTISPENAATESARLYALNYHPAMSAEAVYAAYKSFDERVGARHRTHWRPHHNDPAPERKLRIGYVSPDFVRHSSQRFVEPLLEHHDREAFELFAYARVVRPDGATAAYKRQFDHWCDTLRLNDKQLTDRIRADEIDILVDLAAHTANSRLAVFARKPAPVSITWMGYGTTTGLSAIDYYLTDPYSTPEGSDHLFSEKPWRLDGPPYSFRPNPSMGEVSPLPALERGYVTFCTLSRSIRINHRTVRVWSDILHRVPGSRLAINSKTFTEPAMCDAMAAHFAAHGIGHDRLEMGFSSPPWDTLRSVDIGFDCFPHNSGTTLFENLYMGVPYVTLADRPSVGRLGSMSLAYCGHPEWIAKTEDEYVEIAVDLASDLGRLSELRQSLRAETSASPLMDEAGVTRKIETAYREMWRAWCRGENRIEDQMEGVAE